tara:strand:+ start:275 stop:796 length:522 start_codon:yes stop_codon:yes gene_type:complete
MATRVQFRRGTTSEHSSFTGAVGEVTVDTTKKAVVVHDGSTAGGVPAGDVTLAGAQTFTGIKTYNAAQRGQVTTLTSSSNATAIDLSVNNFFTITLSENTTFGAPTNAVAGQAGSIFIVQDGSGSRTGSFHSNFKFTGGADPTLTTTANAVDRIDYVVKSSTEIHAVATLALA